MPPGVSGSLVTQDFLERELPGVCGSAPSIGVVHLSSYRRWHRAAERAFGPTAPVRTIFHACAVPLVEWLGFQASSPATIDERCAWTVLSGSGAFAGLLVVPWRAGVDGRAREAARRALAAGLRWAFVTNGRTLRIVDATRPWAHQHLDFDLAICRDVPSALATLRVVCEANALRETPPSPSRLARLVKDGDRHTLAVCSALGGGVRRALEELTGALLRASRARPSALESAYSEALTALYRLLFLLFAESRRLVPAWHALYRAAYTVEALVDRVAAGGPSRGLWASLQAMARLAHAGASAGDLRVTAFNGRLFSPGAAPLLDGVSLDDDAVARALRSLALAASPQGARRIAYGDLGVEQLGGIYEHLLDYTPRLQPASAVPTLARHPRAAAARKATGTFYTPRTITDYVVRQTLGPLVAGRGPEEILRIRVVDPAMGSGAFLVSACRFLAQAYESALIESGEAAGGDLDDRDRAAFHRLVASRCLFGVDSNPMAVQLARLSLWLTTLAADRPLSFLDHHVICGNSLAGASPLDLARQAPGRGRAATPAPPLLALLEASEGLAALRPIREQLAERLDDSVEIVRWKEETLSTLRRNATVDRWRTACDLWCAAWWLPGRHRPGLFHALIDRALGRPAASGPAWLTKAMDDALALARRQRFCHWPLEFPEVFLDEQGHPAADGGFDAVIGNPPWEMIRADGPEADREGRALVRFVRESGVYTIRSRGHVNQFQLFVERALSLAGPGGRIGLVLPGALATDVSCASLRRRLFDTCRVDALVGFENRRAIFPIHRSMRFVVMIAATGARTEAIPCCQGETDPSVLERLDSPSAFPLTIARSLLERLSGPGLAIPEVRTGADLALTERLHVAHPPLGAPSGWGAAFGRELNASEDRDLFGRGPRGSDAFPIVEGRQIAPFRVDLQSGRTFARRDAVRGRLGTRAGALDRPRLAYRDVAGASNRVTLIAAVLPPDVVSVHTVFCLRSALSLDEQDVLCVLLNSYAANYLVRQRVSTHVTTAIVERLPVPRPSTDNRLYERLRGFGERLRTGRDEDARADLLVRAQATAARAYGLTAGDLALVLERFPLVDPGEKQAVLQEFIREAPQAGS